MVKVLEDQGRHGLETGDCVTFSRVRGLDGMLKADQKYEVKVTGPHTFELVGVDASGCSEPATQVRGTAFGEGELIMRQLFRQLRTSHFR